MNIHPRSLPKARDQMARLLTDPASPLLRSTATNPDQMAPTAAALRASQLYWVAPDMAALAISSGTQLEEARWATADRPSPCGLIVFDGGIGHITAHGVQVPIDACTWGPGATGCVVGLWIARRRLLEAANTKGQRLEADGVPPLVPVTGFELPGGAEPVPMAGLPEEAPRPVIAALAASWLLMQQPQLVDRTAERPDKSVRRAYARAGREDPEVTVVDLRRRYVPQDRDPDAGTDGRRYRHRWVVSGHWRDTPYGPRGSLRRKQWIPAHLKGPEGAPILATEKVNVWRR